MINQIKFLYNKFFYSKWKERQGAYQIISLILSAIIVHIIYMLVIDPIAEMALINQAVQSDFNLAVTLKDIEQELCFIAMFWAFFIIWSKHEEIKKTDLLFTESGRRGQGNFLETQQGDVILPESKDMQKYRAIFENMEQQGKDNNILYRAVASCLDRFFTTAQVMDATDALQQTCTMEADRLETGLSIVRYLTWVIPSIGFVGTVRGIGLALGQAEEAVQGNIAPVTESLGTAFNSTLIALMISIFVMFFVHRLQESQESLLLNVQKFCNDHLLRYLREKEK